LMATLAVATENAPGPNAVRSGEEKIVTPFWVMTSRLESSPRPTGSRRLDSFSSPEVAGVLNGITFVFFGAILLGPALGDLNWELALYAVLSLTLVRMLPVAIAMLGTQARAPTLGFLGWFGPRGLASIVFAVIVIEESNLPHEHLIVLAVYLTVGLSVFAHGLSAAPLATRYAHWYEQHPRDKAPPMESAPTDVTRPRGPAAQRGEAGN